MPASLHAEARLFEISKYRARPYARSVEPSKSWKPLRKAYGAPVPAREFCWDACFKILGEHVRMFVTKCFRHRAFQDLVVEICGCNDPRNRLQSRDRD